MSMSTGTSLLRFEAWPTHSNMLIAPPLHQLLCQIW